MSIKWPARRIFIMKKSNLDTLDPHQKPEHGLPLFQNVRETSLEAHREIKNTGKLGSQAKQIYQLLLEAGRDMSLQEICGATGLQINAVSGRINEMKRHGLVDDANKRKCRVTGRTIIPLRV